MATFTWVPDHGASSDVNTRVNSLAFGDGYEQRSTDGLNTVSEDWSLNFTLRTKAEITAIADFLRERGGYERFDWTTPMGDALVFICKRWSPVATHDGNWSLSCVFEQRFEV